jgi:hypothetical protein
MAPTKHLIEAAIDPVGLVLSGKWLDIYYLKQHPDDSPFATISKILRDASPAERQAVTARATQLATFAAETQKAISAKV